MPGATGQAGDEGGAPVLSDKDTTVVSLAGEVTYDTVPVLRDRLNALAAHHRTIVVNMSSVSYIDSSGLAALLGLNRRMRAGGGQLVLANVSERIMRALRQARVSELIPSVGARSLSHDTLLDTPAEAPILVRTISVPCDPTRMSDMRRRMSDFFETLGTSREQVYDLTLALGEALGNAFDHGGGAQRDGSVMVSVSLYTDRVVMEVTDCGCGCTYHTGDELPEPTETRGRGIRLMLMLVDAVSIEPRKGGGTCVRLVKLMNSGISSQLAQAISQIRTKVSSVTGAASASTPGRDPQVATA